MSSFSVFLVFCLVWICIGQFFCFAENWASLLPGVQKVCFICLFRAISWELEPPSSCLLGCLVFFKLCPCYPLAIELKNISFIHFITSEDKSFFPPIFSFEVVPCKTSHLMTISAFVVVMNFSFNITSPSTAWTFLLTDHDANRINKLTWFDVVNFLFGGYLVSKFLEELAIKEFLQEQVQICDF